MNTPRDKLLTVDDVAERLNVHPGTVRRWLAAGELRGIKLARTTWRIPESEVDRLITAGAAVAEIDADAWHAGYDAALAGMPAMSPGDVDVYSWQSGYIAGAALRRNGGDAD